MSEIADKHHFPDCVAFDLSAHEFNAIASDQGIEFEPVSSREWVQSRAHSLSYEVPFGSEIVLRCKADGGYEVLHGAESIPWLMDFRNFHTIKFILFEGQDPPDFTALRDRCINLLIRYCTEMVGTLNHLSSRRSRSDWRICHRSRAVERVSVPEGLEVTSVLDYGPFIAVSGTVGLDWPARIVLVSGDGIQPVNRLPYDGVGPEGLEFPYIEYPYRCMECPSCVSTGE